MPKLWICMVSTDIHEMSVLKSPCSYRSMDIHVPVRAWILGPGQVYIDYSVPGKKILPRMLC